MIKVIDDFMNEEECEYYLKYLSDNDNNRTFSTVAKMKNLKISDIETSTKIFNKLCIIIDDVIEPDKFVYSASYNENETFDIHTDSGSYFNIVNGIKRISKYTLLIYLTDKFEGGETIFYDNEYNEIQKVIPKKGRGVFFNMNILHKGERVKKCIENKTWIGIEIIGNFQK